MLFKSIKGLNKTRPSQTRSPGKKGGMSRPKWQGGGVREMTQPLQLATESDEPPEEHIGGWGKKNRENAQAEKTDLRFLGKKTPRIATKKTPYSWGRKRTHSGSGRERKGDMPSSRNG